MKVNKTTKNALSLVTRLLSEIDPKRAVDLAENLSLPKEFTLSILSDLARVGIIDAIKGPNGGFKANDRTLTVSVGQVVDALKTAKNEENKEITNYNVLLVENFFEKATNQIRNVLVSDLGRF